MPTAQFGDRTKLPTLVGEQLAWRVYAGETGKIDTDNATRRIHLPVEFAFHLQ